MSTVLVNEHGLSGCGACRGANDTVTNGSRFAAGLLIECGVNEIFVAQLMTGESRGTFALQHFGDRLVLFSAEVDTEMLTWTT